MICSMMTTFVYSVCNRPNPKTFTNDLILGCLPITQTLETFVIMIIAVIDDNSTLHIGSIFS